jgi:hypothetical protein
MLCYLPFISLLYVTLAFVFIEYIISFLFHTGKAVVWNSWRAFLPVLGMCQDASTGTVRWIFSANHRVDTSGWTVAVEDMRDRL